MKPDSRFACRATVIRKLLVLSILAANVPAIAQPWSSTRPMRFEGRDHTTTLLKSGMVLVAGGAGRGRDAEIFDPSTGVWSTTGRLVQSRSSGHTATLLPSGDVLVVGGTRTPTLRPGAELFVPETGEWSAPSSMAPARHRSRHTATRLPSGRVLVAGGFEDCFRCGLEALSSVQLYDPAERRWSDARDLVEPRHSHTATLLPSGKVLVVGGVGATGSSLNSAELFDPTSGTWSLLTPGPSFARMDHTATLLYSGEVLIVGGGPLETELYDWRSGAWTTGGILQTPRRDHAATLLPSSEVLIVGGYTAASGAFFKTETVEIFNPRTQPASWRSGSALGIEIAAHGATLLPSGQVLVTGGGPVGSEVKLYDPTLGSSTRSSSLSKPRSNHTATPLGPERVLILGSQRADSPGGDLVDTASGWVLSPLSIADLLPTTRHTATPLASGDVLIVGGILDGGFAAAQVLDRVQIFDPDENALSAVCADVSVGICQLPRGLHSHTATPLGSGDVLLVGGSQKKGTGGGGAVGGTYRIDPTTGSVTEVASMHDQRASHTATILGSGHVLIVGGRSNQVSVDTAEVYEPRADRWSVVGRMANPRSDHTATRLPSGKVLVAGGMTADDGVPLSSAEIYDPATGLWTPTGAMAHARASHTATLLGGGRVLVAGGKGSSSALSSVEIFDPATGTWRLLEPLHESRSAHTATLLSSGDIFITGGRGDTGELSSTELYSIKIIPAENVRPVVHESLSPIEYLDPGASGSFSIHGTFRGFSEAGGGATSSSTTNDPFIHLISLDGRQQHWLEPDALPPTNSSLGNTNGWDAPMTLTFSRLPPTLQPGPHILTVVTAGVPSEAIPIDVACSVGTTSPRDLEVDLLDLGLFELETQGAVAIQWETCHGDSTTTCAPPVDPKDPQDRGGPGWRAIPGATTSALVTDPVQAQDSGSLYRAIVDGHCASKRSAPAELTVYDRTKPGDGTDVPVAVVSPSGGELWRLSSADETLSEAISWTMSDDIRVCRVQTDLVYSIDGGQTFPSSQSIPLRDFDQGQRCHHPGEERTSHDYQLPNEPPSGQAGSLYKIRVTVTDHADNSTVAVSEQPFFIVEPNNESIRTLILWHSDRMPETGVGDLDAALVNLAAHPSVRGWIVDLAEATRLETFYTAWDNAAEAAETACAAGATVDADLCHAETERSVDAANDLLFAQGGIHDYVHDEFRKTFTAVEHLIVAGDDSIIPLARVADGTRIAAEHKYPSVDGKIDLTSDGTRVGRALEANYYFSDDPLATEGRIEARDLGRRLFIPHLAIGRLVETPAEIVASIAKFISQSGVIDLSAAAPSDRSDKVFVSAYDFLVDSGTVISDQWRTVFDTGINSRQIGQSWTSEDLRDELCVSTDGYGVVSLNGHATHHQLGHPSGDPYRIEGTSTKDLSSCKLSGSLVYAVGCHSGLPVPGPIDPDNESGDDSDDHPLDLPQTMLRAGAIAYLGNTGYGWGLKFGIGYSERLVELFTRELTARDEIEIGEAVRRAKERYDREAISFDVYDEKVSMQWTLFGFPMARLKLGDGDTQPAPRPFDSPPPKAAERPYRERVGDVTIERRLVGTTIVDGVAVTPPQYVSREIRRFDFSAEGVYKLFNVVGEEVGPDGASLETCLASAHPRADDATTPPGCYYTLNNLSSGDLSSSTTDRPIQPVFVSDVGLSGTRFQGFLWMGGTYEETADWIPVFAELQSNIRGDFSYPGALPSNSRSNGRGTIRHGSPLGEECTLHLLDQTSLALEAGEAVQDADETFSIQRRYESIDVELFYYNDLAGQGQDCDVDGPEVTAEHTVAGSTISWQVRPVRAAEIDEIWRVVVLWTDNTVDASGHGRWQPLELELDAAADTFRGSLDIFGSQRLTYFVQAVDTKGNVSLISAADPEATSGVTHELPKIVDVEMATSTADLGVAFGPTPESVAGLTALSTTVDVTNFGPQDAGGLLITIDVSANLGQASAHGDGWTCSASGSVLRCSRSLLPVGSSAPIHLTGTAPHDGQIPLRATAQATSRDPQPYNDSVTRTVPVEPAQRADLTITQDASLTGDVLSLSIHVANDGPTSAHQATVSALLPPLLHDVSWRCLAEPPSRCKSAGVGPLVDRADVVHDGRVRYVVTAHVPSDVRSVIETTATVTPPAGLHDPAPASNTSTILIDLASPLFAAGFESGELTSWSDAVGAPPDP